MAIPAEGLVPVVLPGGVLRELLVREVIPQLPSQLCHCQGALSRRGSWRGEAGSVTGAASWTVGRSAGGRFMCEAAMARAAASSSLLSALSWVGGPLSVPRRGGVRELLNVDGRLRVLGLAGPLGGESGREGGSLLGVLTGPGALPLPFSLSCWAFTPGVTISSEGAGASEAPGAGGASS